MSVEPLPLKNDATHVYLLFTSVVWLASLRVNWKTANQYALRQIASYASSTLSYSSKLIFCSCVYIFCNGLPICCTVAKRHAVRHALQLFIRMKERLLFFSPKAGWLMAPGLVICMHFAKVGPKHCYHMRVGVSFPLPHLMSIVSGMMFK